MDPDWQGLSSSSSSSSSARRKKGKDAFSMPLTERQQLAYLLSMTAKETKGDDSNDDIIETKKFKKTRLSPTSLINRPKNKSGETALHLAATKGDLETTKSLIRQGADVNCKDNADWTPLHEACNHGHYKVSKILLKAGANVNAGGLDGDTPLHDASSNGHLKICLALLKYGANPHAKNHSGETPIDLAEGQDVLTILKNFKKDDLKVIKSGKEFNASTQEKQFGSSEKQSSKSAAKSHRRLLNLDDFLDSETLEDSNSTSSTSAPTSSSTIPTKRAEHNKDDHERKKEPWKDNNDGFNEKKIHNFSEKKNEEDGEKKLKFTETLSYSTEKHSMKKEEKSVREDIASKNSSIATDMMGFQEKNKHKKKKHSSEHREDETVKNKHGDSEQQQNFHKKKKKKKNKKHLDDRPGEKEVPKQKNLSSSSTETIKSSLTPKEKSSKENVSFSAVERRQLVSTDLKEKSKQEKLSDSNKQIQSQTPLLNQQKQQQQKQPQLQPQLQPQQQLKQQQLQQQQQQQQQQKSETNTTAIKKEKPKEDKLKESAPNELPTVSLISKVEREKTPKTEKIATHNIPQHTSTQKHELSTGDTIVIKEKHKKKKHDKHRDRDEEYRKQKSAAKDDHQNKDHEKTTDSASIKKQGVVEQTTTKIKPEKSTTVFTTLELISEKTKHEITLKKEKKEAKQKIKMKDLFLPDDISKKNSDSAQKQKPKDDKYLEEKKLPKPSIDQQHQKQLEKTNVHKEKDFSDVKKKTEEKHEKQKIKGGEHSNVKVKGEHSSQKVKGEHLNQLSKIKPDGRKSIEEEKPVKLSKYGMEPPVMPKLKQQSDHKSEQRIEKKVMTIEQEVKPLTKSTNTTKPTKPLTPGKAIVTTGSKQIQSKKKVHLKRYTAFRDSSEESESSSDSEEDGDSEDSESESESEDEKRKVKKEISKMKTSDSTVRVAEVNAPKSLLHVKNEHTSSKKILPNLAQKDVKKSDEVTAQNVSLILTQLNQPIVQIGRNDGLLEQKSNLNLAQTSDVSSTPSIQQQMQETQTAKIGTDIKEKKEKKEKQPSESKHKKVADRDTDKEADRKSCRASKDNTNISTTIFSKHDEPDSKFKKHELPHNKPKKEDELLPKQTKKQSDLERVPKKLCEIDSISEKLTPETEKKPQQQQQQKRKQGDSSIGISLKQEATVSLEFKKQTDNSTKLPSKEPSTLKQQKAASDQHIKEKQPEVNKDLIKEEKSSKKEPPSWKGVAINIFKGKSDNIRTEGKHPKLSKEEKEKQKLKKRLSMEKKHKSHNTEKSETATLTSKMQQKPSADISKLQKSTTEGSKMSSLGVEKLIKQCDDSATVKHEAKLPHKINKKQDMEVSDNVKQPSMMNALDLYFEKQQEQQNLKQQQQQQQLKQQQHKQPEISKSKEKKDKKQNKLPTETSVESNSFKSNDKGKDTLKDDSRNDCKTDLKPKSQEKDVRRERNAISADIDSKQLIKDQKFPSIPGGSTDIIGDFQEKKFLPGDHLQLSSIPSVTLKDVAFEAEKFEKISTKQLHSPVKKEHFSLTTTDHEPHKKKHKRKYHDEIDTSLQPMKIKKKSSLDENEVLNKVEKLYCKKKLGESLSLPTSLLPSEHPRKSADETTAKIKKEDHKETTDKKAAVKINAEKAFKEDPEEKSKTSTFIEKSTKPPLHRKHSGKGDKDYFTKTPQEIDQQHKHKHEVESTKHGKNLDTESHQKQKLEQLTKKSKDIPVSKAPLKIKEVDFNQKLGMNSLILKGMDNLKKRKKKRVSSECREIGPESKIQKLGSEQHKNLFTTTTTTAVIPKDKKSKHEDFTPRAPPTISRTNEIENIFGVPPPQNIINTDPLKLMADPLKLLEGTAIFKNKKTSSSPLLGPKADVKMVEDPLFESISKDNKSIGGTPEKSDISSSKESTPSKRRRTFSMETSSFEISSYRQDDEIKSEEELAIMNLNADSKYDETENAVENLLSIADEQDQDGFLESSATFSTKVSENQPIDETTAKEESIKEKDEYEEQMVSTQEDDEMKAATNLLLEQQADEDEEDDSVGHQGEEYRSLPPPVKRSIRKSSSTRTSSEDEPQLTPTRVENPGKSRRKTSETTEPAVTESNLPIDVTGSIDKKPNLIQTPYVPKLETLLEGFPSHTQLPKVEVFSKDNVVNILPIGDLAASLLHPTEAATAVPADGFYKHLQQQHTEKEFSTLDPVKQDLERDALETLEEINQLVKHNDVFESPTKNINTSPNIISPNVIRKPILQPPNFPTIPAHATLNIQRYPQQHQLCQTGSLSSVVNRSQIVSPIISQQEALIQQQYQHQQHELFKQQQLHLQQFKQLEQQQIQQHKEKHQQELKEQHILQEKQQQQHKYHQEEKLKQEQLFQQQFEKQQREFQQQEHLKQQHLKQHKLYQQQLMDHQIQQEKRLQQLQQEKLKQQQEQQKHQQVQIQYVKEQQRKEQQIQQQYHDQLQQQQLLKQQQIQKQQQDKLKLEQEQAELKQRQQQEKLEQEQLDQEQLKQQKLHQEQLQEQKLRQEQLQQQKLRQEQLEKIQQQQEQERIKQEQERLKQQQEQELLQQHLEKERLHEQEQMKQQQEQHRLKQRQQQEILKQRQQEQELLKEQQQQQELLKQQQEQFKQQQEEQRLKQQLEQELLKQQQQQEQLKQQQQQEQLKQQQQQEQLKQQQQQEQLKKQQEQERLKHQQEKARLQQLQGQLEKQNLMKKQPEQQQEEKLKQQQQPQEDQKQLQQQQVLGQQVARLQDDQEKSATPSDQTRTTVVAKEMYSSSHLVTSKILSSKNFDILHSSQQSELPKLEISTAIPAVKQYEFPGLISPHLPIESNRYHDLDCIDASDLLKTEKTGDILSNSAGSLTLNRELESCRAEGGQDHSISKVVDCLLEMDTDNEIEQHFTDSNISANNSMSSNDFSTVANLNSSIASIVQSGVTHVDSASYCESLKETFSYLSSATPEELQYITSQINQLSQQEAHKVSADDFPDAPQEKQHITHHLHQEKNMSEPLYVSTSIPTRLSSSDEKMYSPKHISAGEKLYSPKPSQITSAYHTEKRKVDIEPCGTFRDLMLSDLPPVPDVSIVLSDLPPVPVPDVSIVAHSSKVEPQEKENRTEEQQMETDTSAISKTSNTSELEQETEATDGDVDEGEKKEGDTEDEETEAPKLRTWREAIKTRCTVVKPKVEARSFDDILKPVMQTDDYNELMKKAQNNSELGDLLLQHAAQKEKLNLSMVQEFARIQCGSKLYEEEKGPLGAALVVYYQKDDIGGTLGRTLEFKNRTTHQPDLEKLYEAKLDDLKDKYRRLLETLSSQQLLEIDALKRRQQIDDNQLDQKEMLRQRYLRLRKRMMAY